MFHISVIILNNVQFTLRKKVLYDVSFLRKSIQFDFNLKIKQNFHRYGRKLNLLAKFHGRLQ